MQVVVSKSNRVKRKFLYRIYGAKYNLNNKVY